MSSYFGTFCKKDFLFMLVSENLFLLIMFFSNKSFEIHFLRESSKQLTEEVYKPIIRNFKKRTAYSGFKGNIRGADLADMQLISKFNKGFRFLLCVIDIFSNMLGLFL